MCSGALLFSGDCTVQGAAQLQCLQRVHLKVAGLEGVVRTLWTHGVGAHSSSGMDGRADEDLK